jgi:hypothetical protein
MRAGKALIEACEREFSDRHDPIYPILFCYRHGLEMAMKWIVGRFAHYLEVPGPEPDLWQLRNSEELSRLSPETTELDP